MKLQSHGTCISQHHTNARPIRPIRPVSVKKGVSTACRYSLKYCLKHWPGAWPSYRLPGPMAVVVQCATAAVVHRSVVVPAGTLVRAQIIADKPKTDHQSQPEPVSTTSSSSSSEAGTSACPFLNALNPPVVMVPWHKRLEQITKPVEFQRMILDDAVKQGDSMVALEKTAGFLDAYVPATGDAVKTIFGGEAGTEPIVRQSSVPSFGKSSHRAKPAAAAGPALLAFLVCLEQQSSQSSPSV